MQLLQVLKQVCGVICDTLQRYGAAATLHDILYRIVNKVANFQILKGMTVRVQDVTDPTLFEAPGFNARFVSADQLTKFAYDGVYDLSVEFLNKALSRGDRCYALFDGDALASYGWYSELPTPIDEHFLLHYDRDYIYMYKGYTVPAYRGKRLHAVGMCGALRAFTEEGKKGLISFVLSNNFASLRSITRMGYQIFGDVSILRADNRSFTYATRSCRDYGFWVEPLNPPRRRLVLEFIRSVRFFF